MKIPAYTFCLLLACLLCGSSSFAAGRAENASSVASQFDHLTTGFELTGSHRRLRCESCHVDGVFKGTPTYCSGCHAAGTRILAGSKPVSHVLSTANCGDCHSTVAWAPASRFDHTQVEGSCMSCHNGVQAAGKTPTHVVSSDACENCHTTTAWTPARFDHTGVQKGSCATCHNGVNASGKPLTHIATVQSCDACHSTVAWTPALFDHATITGGCQSCHNGASATGKAAGHMTTSRECNICHSTTAWTPLVFRHSSAEYPGDHNSGLGLTCTRCHATNTDAATWTAAAYRPNCAGCHANRYKSDPHDKVDGRSKYTVSELRDCTGACHIYKDTALTTIATRRTGPHHKVTDRDFGD